MKQAFDPGGNEKGSSAKGGKSAAPGRAVSLVIVLVLAAMSFALSVLSIGAQGPRGGIFKLDISFLEVDESAPKVYEVVREMIREVTAYNVGILEQTDNNPCIGATGENLCKKVAQGESICATNSLPFGTRLHIENYGECVVMDRMNRRYKSRVDIAMGPGERDRALDFGIQKLTISILKEID
jgi:3D (Asp-Asp-Asp) domain-containing protein